VPGAWTLLGGLLVLAALVAVVRSGDWRHPGESTGSSVFASGLPEEREVNPGRRPGAPLKTSWREKGREEP
jgi:hypothetical protein